MSFHSSYKPEVLLGLRAGDPDCLHIPGLTIEKGNTYTLVVSDKDDLDAVLPVGVVQHLKVRRPLTLKPAAPVAELRCA